MSKYLLNSLLFLALLFGFGASVQAQDTLAETYTTHDGTFRLRYPSDWSVDEAALSIVSLDRDGGLITIMTPATLDFIGGSLLDAKSAKEVMSAFIASAGPGFTFGEPVKVVLPSGTVGYRAALTVNNETGNSVAEGFALTVPVSADAFAIIYGIPTGMDEADLKMLVYQVAESFEVGEFVVPGAVTGNLPSLRLIGAGGSADDWRPAIAELRRLDLVPAGGEAVFGEDMRIYGLQPGLYIDPDSSSEYQDFAMAALISLRVIQPDDLVLCGLMTRVTQTKADNLNTFLVVAATESNTILVMNRYTPAADPFVYETGPVAANFHDPQHLLYIVRDNELTVFVNGEAVIEALPLPIMPPSTEPVLAGVNLDRDCVMTGIWAYGLPSADQAGAPEPVVTTERDYSTDRADHHRRACCCDRSTRYYRPACRDLVAGNHQDAHRGVSYACRAARHYGNAL